MATCWTENGEEKADEKGREISPYCLGLPTILRRILEQFSTTELIQLSLVSKLWSFEARSVMRERGNVRAAIKYTCEKLVDFGSDFEKMSVVPFAGMDFLIFHCYDCTSFAIGSLHRAYNIILARLPWKYFSVRFYNNDLDNTKACHQLFLVQKVLQDYCGVLQELCLEFGNDFSMDIQFLASIFYARSFTCLKIFRVKRRYVDGGHEFRFKTFLKNLVSCAPNLQELHVENYDGFMENILEGSSATLILHGDLEPLFRQFCESLIPSLRAEKMDILLQDVDVDLELLKWYTPKLLHASRYSLHTLRMDLLFAVPLMCYGICLESVTILKLHMNCCSLSRLEPSVRKLPTGLDFTRVFPNLTEVMILDNHESDFSPDVISAFVERGQAVLSSTLPDRAINIKVLKIDRCLQLHDFTIPVLAQMFPDVKKVQVQRKHQGASLAELWWHFLGLEEVIDST